MQTPDETRTDAEPQAMALTVLQACKLLNVSRATLYRQIKTGALPTLKVGNTRRIRPEALREYLAALEAKAS